MNLYFAILNYNVSIVFAIFCIAGKDQPFAMLPNFVAGSVFLYFYMNGINQKEK